ncbi:MAG: 6-phosphogluconolactonase [Syntrophobacteraceae bacterium]|nr:6-phosphogluconolactonase [Syntrophobacteraceae bacterium]
MSELSVVVPGTSDTPCSLGRMAANRQYNLVTTTAQIAMTRLHVFPDNPGFVRGAADFIVGAAADAIAERGRFIIALSGGGTPRPVYARLATADYRDRIQWDKVHVFFGDERCVPPDDPRSNYRMVRDAWLDHSPIPAENIHRIRGEDDPAIESLRYEQDMARLVRSDRLPVLDLILLGMGHNGHTASLFPGTAALREMGRRVVAQYVEVVTAWRVTFTAPLINAGRHVVFLVEGTGKAEMLWNVLQGPFQPDVWPAQLIQPMNGELHWLVDAAAAAKVVKSPG